MFYKYHIYFICISSISQYVKRNRFEYTMTWFSHERLEMCGIIMYRCNLFCNRKFIEVYKSALLCRNCHKRYLSWINLSVILQVGQSSRKKCFIINHKYIDHMILLCFFYAVKYVDLPKYFNVSGFIYIVWNQFFIRHNAINKLCK